MQATIAIGSFAQQMVASGAFLVIGSGIFLIGSGIFFAASTAFKMATEIFHAAVEELADAVETAVQVGETIKEIGENTIGGFIEGVESQASGVIDTVTTVAGSVVDTFCDVLDIHSPSEVLRSIGLNTIAGYVEGIEEGEPVTEVIMQAISDGIESLGFTDLFDEGSLTTNALCSGLEDGGSNCMDYMNALAGGISNSCDGIIEDLRNTIYTLERASEYAQIYGGEDSDAYKIYQDRLALAKNELDRYEMGSYTKMEAPGFGGGSSPVSTDMPDISSLMSSSNVGGTGSGRGTSSDLANTVSRNSGSGTGINDLSQGGNTINSNNTYNFVQNNYSPEALDRTEIYQQTQYQLKSWYGWLQSNPM